MTPAAPANPHTARLAVLRHDISEAARGGNFKRLMGLYGLVCQERALAKHWHLDQLAQELETALLDTVQAGKTAEAECRKASMRQLDATAARLDTLTQQARANRSARDAAVAQTKELLAHLRRPAQPWRRPTSVERARTHRQGIVPAVPTGADFVDLLAYLHAHRWVLRSCSTIAAMQQRLQAIGMQQYPVSHPHLRRLLAGALVAYFREGAQITWLRDAVAPIWQAAERLREDGDAGAAFPVIRLTDGGNSFGMFRKCKYVTRWNEATQTWDGRVHVMHLPNEDWVYLKPALAVGGEGSIYVCRRSDGGVFALKEFRKNPSSGTRAKPAASPWEKIINECTVTARALPQLAPQAVFETSTRYIVALPLLFGNLISVLPYLMGRAGSQAAELEVQSRVAAAVQALHQKGLTHNDIKAENVMCVNGELFLGDFGMSAPVEQYNMNANAYVMAPELLPTDLSDGGATSPASDIWSLGLLFLDIFGAQPIAQWYAYLLQAPSPWKTPEDIPAALRYRIYELFEAVGEMVRRGIPLHMPQDLDDCDESTSEMDAKAYAIARGAWHSLHHATQSYPAAAQRDVKQTLMRMLSQDEENRPDAGEVVRVWNRAKAATLSSAAQAALVTAWHELPQFCETQQRNLTWLDRDTAHLKAQALVQENVLTGD